MFRSILSLLLLASSARAAVVQAPSLRGVLPVLAPVWAVGPSWTPAAPALALSAPALTLTAPSLTPALPVAAAPARAMARPEAAVLPLTPAAFDGRSQPVAAALAASVQAIGRAPAAEAGPRLREIFSGPAPGRGEANGVREDEAAFVRVNRERRAEAQKVAYAKREFFDYRRGAFSPARAAEFAARALPLGEKAAVTGRDLLNLVMTKHAVHLDVPLDPARSDLSQVGVSEADLRAKTSAAGMRPYAVAAALEDAYRQGLVYRLHDEKGGRTLYGVPYEVRATLQLTVPEAVAPESTPTPKAGPSPLGRAALGLLARAETSADAELMEYVLQLAVAAVEDGHLAAADLPAGAMERWQALRLGSTSFGSSLLTVVETAQGGPLFADAKALARQAAETGLVDAGGLDALLRGIR